MSQGEAIPSPEPHAVPAGVVAARFRLVLGGATMLMLGLSWRLWISVGDIPRVPFVAGFDGLAAPHLVFGVLMAAIATAAGLGAAGPRLDPWVGRYLVPALELLSIGLLVVLILADQHRFQPWAYQYVLMTLALAMMAPARALGYARLLTIAIYAYSGLSKLDATFTRELGPLFLGTALAPLGLDPSAWPGRWRVAAVLAMPAVEMLVALGLCFRVMRRVALVGAIGLHAALIGILGPWALDHSTIVLVWNAALLVEDLILFGPRRVVGPVSDGRPALGRSLIELPVKLVFLIAVIMPLFERWGLWDTWPSFALYASHVERVDIYIHDDQTDRYPESVVAHLGPPLRKGLGLRRLNLNGWSIDQRGTPVYPQARATLGLAEALAEAPRGSPRPVYVEVLDQADRFSGKRSFQTLLGYEAIRHCADEFWPNAHPADRVRGPGPARGMRPRPTMR